MATATEKRASKDTGQGQVLVTWGSFDLTGGEPILRTKFAGTPIKEVGPLGERDYEPRGSTPLNDAAAEFIGTMEAAQKRLPDAVHIGLLTDESGSMGFNRQAVINGFNEFIAGLRDEEARGEGGVLIVVFTDGHENASREHTTESVRKLIHEKEARDWDFIYLGANQDAWAEGGARGFSNSVNFTSTPEGTTAAYASVTDTSRRYLQSNSRAERVASVNSLTDVEDPGAGTPDSPAVPASTRTFGNVQDALKKAREEG